MAFGCNLSTVQGLITMITKIIVVDWRTGGNEYCQQEKIVNNFLLDIHDIGQRCCGFTSRCRLDSRRVSFYHKARRNSPVKPMRKPKRRPGWFERPARYTREEIGGRTGLGEKHANALIKQGLPVARQDQKWMMPESECLDCVEGETDKKTLRQASFRS